MYGNKMCSCWYSKEIHILHKTRNEQYESNVVTHQIFDKSLGYFEYGVTCAVSNNTFRDKVLQ
jgi:hypothetical protein